VCLQKDPRRRAQAIGDVRLALEGAFETVAPAEVAASVARHSIWLRWAPLAAAAAIVAVAGFVALRPDVAPTAVRFQIHAPPGTSLPLGTPAISDDGRMLAYTVTDAEGISRIYVRPINRVEARALPGTEGAVHPFWSHDGRSLGFASPNEGQVKRIDLDAAAPQTLATTGAPWHATWSGRDSILFMGGSTLSEVARTGGKPVPGIPPNPDQVVNFPSFLSDGERFLARVISSNTVSIQLAKLGSAERTPVLDTAESAAIVAPTPGGKTYLLYMRLADLVVQEFDERAGVVRGAPRVLVNDIGRVATPPLRPSVGVSPSGVLAYQTGGIGGSRRLTWLDRAGAEVETLPLDASLLAPQLSPDGLQLAGHRVDDGVYNVWVSDLRRGNATRVTFTTPARDPIWSPDGAQIAFRRTNDSGAPGIYVIATEGGTERRLSDIQGRVTSWSPDGKYLLYDLQGKMTMLPLDGGQSIPVGSRNGNSNRGTFSPDGKYIAYTSDESGRNEIYVQAVPSGGRRLQVSITGGTDPRWRRDGKELYWLAPDRSVMAVDIQTGNDLNAGVPKSLFPTTTREVGFSAYTVSTDGQRFLIPSTEKTDAPITVVLNWWSELESAAAR
jgi:Tol biopolymer transport system component